MYSTVSQKCNLLFFCHFSLFSNSRSQLLEKISIYLALFLCYLTGIFCTWSQDSAFSDVLIPYYEDYMLRLNFHTPHLEVLRTLTCFIIIIFWLVGLVLVLEGFLQRFFVFVLFSGLLDIHLWIFNFQSFLFSCYTFYLFCQAHCILSYFSSVFCIPFFLFFFFFSS